MGSAALPAGGCSPVTRLQWRFVFADRLLRLRFPCHSRVLSPVDSDSESPIAREPYKNTGVILFDERTRASRQRA